MKRTVNINLASVPFVIDDDASTLLSQYLETLRRAFAANAPGSDDVVDDIEGRIAELFTERLAAHGASILTIADVQSVISRIGTAEQLTGHNAGNDAEASSPADGAATAAADIPTPPPTQKRLYRDTDDRVLGGVCSGLAHYFGMDPVWMRIIFVVLLFCSFSTLLFVYLILWAIVPPAVTPYQKLQMDGSPATMQNIWSSVKNAYTPSPGAAPYAPARQTPMAMRVLSIIGKCALILLAMIALPVAIASIVGVVIGTLTWISMLFGGGVYLDWMFGHTIIFENATNQLSLGLLAGLVFAGSLVMLVPCVFVLWCTYSMFKKGLYMTKAWVISLLTVWVLSIAAVTVLGICWSHEQATTFLNDTEFNDTEFNDTDAARYSAHEASLDSLDAAMERMHDSLDARHDSLQRAIIDNFHK